MTVRGSKSPVVPRRIGLVSAALIGAVLPLLAPACNGCGNSSGDVTPVVAPARPELPRELALKAWPVQYATPVEQNKLSKGWVTLVLERDLKRATAQLGSDGGLAAARAHSEAAALYRQGALLAAHAYVETYGKTPQEADPLGTAHLLAVSYALLGDLDKARAESNKLDGATDPTGPWHAPWKAWLAGASPTWPPDLSTLPVSLPAHAVGEWPEIDVLPHYMLPERAGSTSTLEMGDPGALVALASWHEAVARSAAGDSAAAVDGYIARYRLPIESKAAPNPLPVEMLFGSDYLVPEDGPFMAALVGEQGAAAVDAFKDTSLLAAIADRARVDGKVEADKVIDLAADLRAFLIEESQKKNGGAEDGAHRKFGDIAQVGVLRALALVAEIEGNRETSGVLRINAMERSNDHAGCPNGVLSLAAWDASNRYPLRASDILHNLVRRYPSLETARYGLDVLAIRVSREATQLPPGI